MRKIIQVSHSHDSNGTQTIIAVCEDGTVWESIRTRNGPQWSPFYLIGGPPGPEDEAVKNILRLLDGLSEMIESGRLTETDIPDDYQWLVKQLEKCAAGREP